jgi:hypothetical protein
MTVGFLVLPVTRNSIWTHVFALSWENTIRYHILLGYSFLMIVLLHAIYWWKVFVQEPDHTFNPFSVPLASIYMDDFTVPLASHTAVATVIVMGGLSLHAVRRKCYELFYYSHHLFMVIFLVMLWHAV